MNWKQSIPKIKNLMYSVGSSPLQYNNRFYNVDY